MTEEITLNGEVIKRGQSKEISINIARLPTHTVIDLPVFVFRGEKDGPSVLISAGLHGDEINGIEVIRRLIAEKKLKPKTGTIIAVPVVNIYGFIHNSRKFPDGKDLNRSFPGNENGSLASRIAAMMTKEIIPNIDYGIDFHTGGASKLNYPHLRTNLKIKKNVELAHAFGPPFIVNSVPPDHSFRKEAHKAGKYILTFEGGESLRFDKNTIQEGLAGIQRFLINIGICEGESDPRKTKILRSSRWRRASNSGLFHSAVESGQKVKRYQLLGHINDPFGENEFKIKANKGGYIIGLNNMCVVNKGDALIHIGYEAE